MQDPIVHREAENTPENSLTNGTEEIADSLVNRPKGGDYVPIGVFDDGEDGHIEQVLTGYYIQTDHEIVNIQSNIILPSGLRAYNESGGNTYVEYMTGRLTPIPEVSRDQQAIIYKGFSSLFIGFGLFLSFGFMLVSLFRLLTFKGTK